MLLEKLKVMLTELFYENNSLSLTRLIAFGGYLLFENCIVRYIRIVAQTPLTFNRF